MPKREMQLSDEERARRSALAKKLHAERKFGGRQPGSGRPKKPRAQEVVAEGVREDGKKILAALRDALNNGSPNLKFKAALEMLQIERKETEFMLNQHQQIYDNMKKDELLALIRQRLEQLEKSGTSVEDIIDLKPSSVRELS